MLGAVEARFEQLLARVVAGQRFQRRLLRRVLQRQHIAAELAVLGSLLRRGELFLATGRRAPRVRHVQRAGLGGRQQLLGEAVCSVLSRLFMTLSCACFAGRQLGAGMDELLVIDVEQLRLLGLRFSSA